MRRLFITFLLFASLSSFGQDKLSLKSAEAFYDYAYPMVMMKISQDLMLTSPLRQNQNTNQFIMFKQLAQPENTAVVLGNRNTLYCVAWIDLSDGPVLFEIPKMNNRYYVMPLIDAWTNTFESLGSRTTGQKAQKYILTRTDYDGKLPDGYTQIQCPTSMVWITGRIEADDEEDALKANELQDEYILKTLNPLDSTKAYAATFLSKDIKKAVPYSLEMSPEKFLNVFFALLKDNPTREEDQTFLKQYSFMQDASNWSFGKFSSQDQEIWKRAIQNRQNHFKQSFYAGTEQTTTWDFKIDNMEDWGTDYYRRAYIAAWGIGANIPQDAVYGMTQLDANMEQLNGSNTYKISFEPEGTPEVGGFWSITAYNIEGYLEANAQNRYSSGSNMPLRYNSDGSLDIYLATTKPKGAANVNWVPIPQGDFKILFRMYWPSENVLDGNYILPDLIKSNKK